MMLFTVAPALQHAAAERVRVLGITSAKRSALRPDIPTIAEAGLAGYAATTRTGLLAPANTPREIVTRLREAVVKSLHTPQARTQPEAQGVDIAGGTSEEFAAFIKDDLARHARVLKLAGSKME